MDPRRPPLSVARDRRNIQAITASSPSQSVIEGLEARRAPPSSWCRTHPSCDVLPGLSLVLVFINKLSRRQLVELNLPKRSIVIAKTVHLMFKKTFEVVNQL
jgi:hypothetical protein